MNQIIAVDFDGTLCEHKYPEIGRANIPLIELMKELRAKGARIILWTCRGGKELSEAVEWCGTFGLAFDAVNENVEDARFKLKDFGCRKVYANLYIDDRAVSPDGMLNAAISFPKAGVW